MNVPSAAPTVAQVTTASTISAAQGGAEGETTPAAVAAANTVPRPAIVQWRIPFPAKRRAEMAAYSLRHYGEREWRLRDPHLIVEHWTQTPSASATRGIFVPDKRRRRAARAARDLLPLRDRPLGRGLPARRSGHRAAATPSG